MEGGHRTWLREQLMCYGLPLPPYIKEGRRRPATRGSAMGGVLVGFPTPGAPLGPATSSLPSFIYVARGTPKTHKLIV